MRPFRTFSHRLVSCRYSPCAVSLLHDDLSTGNGAKSEQNASGGNAVTVVSTRAHPRPCPSPGPKLKWLHIRTSRTNHTTSTVPLQAVAPSPRGGLLCFACWHAPPGVCIPLLCCSAASSLEVPTSFIDASRGGPKANSHAARMDRTSHSHGWL